MSGRPRDNDLVAQLAGHMRWMKVRAREILQTDDTTRIAVAHSKMSHHRLEARRLTSEIIKQLET